MVEPMNIDEYEGAWMEVYSGSKLHYKDPQPHEIKIRDIAHHLSLICRFTGAVREFYSVAEHCVRVSKIVPPELRLAALLHDAAEAYIGDISRPVKYTHKLERTEKILTDVIDKKYSINSRDPVIRAADNVLLATEARDLMANTDDWAELPSPLPEKIEPWLPRQAEDVFKAAFRFYGGRDDDRSELFILEYDGRPIQEGGKVIEEVRRP